MTMSLVKGLLLAKSLGVKSESTLTYKSLYNSKSEALVTFIEIGFPNLTVIEALSPIFLCSPCILSFASENNSFDVILYILAPKTIFPFILPIVTV